MACQAKPVLTTDLYADFDCNGCGACCHGWSIVVDKEVHDRTREMLQTLPHPGRLGPDDVFDPIDEPTDTAYARLRLRDEDAACVFLDDDNLCYWHKHFGYETKGFVCRAFPRLAYETATSQVVAGSLACRPLVEDLIAYSGGARTMELRPTDRRDWDALELPLWGINRKQAIRLTRDRWAEARGFDIIREALLDIVRVEGVPLARRLVMARLYLDQLEQATGPDGVLTTNSAAIALRRLQRDGTQLYVRALDWDGHPRILGQAVKAFFRVMANLGVSAHVVDTFRNVLDALSLHGPAELAGLHMLRLHDRYLRDVVDELEPLLTLYLQHRLIKAQIVARAGIVGGFYEVLLGYALVWATTLAMASLDTEDKPITAILGDAMSFVELTFLHTSQFFDVWDVQSGFTNIQSVPFAAVLAHAFEPTEPSVVGQASTKGVRP